MSAERKWRFIPTRREGLKIVKITPDKPDEYPYLYRGEEANVCQTKDGSLFRLHINPEAKVADQSAIVTDLFHSVYNQGIINQALAERASDGGQETDEDQKKTNRFLSQNWKPLHPLLYTGVVENALPTGGFSNVNLGSIADFIGAGPDGTMFIFDTSPGRKKDRLEEAEQALRKTIPEVQGRVVLLRASYTNESRNPRKLQMRINVSPNPVRARPRLD